MINTDKGRVFFQNISDNVICKSADYEKVSSYNPQLKTPFYCDQKIHRDLFDDYKENGYKALARFYKKHSDYRKYSLRISCYIPAELKKGIKKVIFLRR